MHTRVHRTQQDTHQSVRAVTEIAVSFATHQVIIFFNSFIYFYSMEAKCMWCIDLVDLHSLRLRLGHLLKWRRSLTPSPMPRAAVSFVCSTTGLALRCVCLYPTKPILYSCILYTRRCSWLLKLIFIIVELPQRPWNLPEEVCLQKCQDR